METPIIITEEITEITVSDEITSVTLEETTTVIESQAEQGPPGPPGTIDYSTIGYEHVQNSPSDTWIIHHNLGFKPNIQIEDSAMDSVIPSRIEQNGKNQSIIYFSGAMGGKAYCS